MAYTNGKTSSDWNTIMEPPSVADAQEGTRPVYPYNNVIQTESGHSFEMDDTPKRERLRLHHRDGTFLEMHPKGDEVHKIYGDGYEIILKNKKVSVKGSCSIHIDGNAAIEVKGDSYSSVKGNYTGIVNGTCNITSKGDMNLTANKELKISSGDDIELTCKTLNVGGDFYVQGDIGCQQSIVAQGNITSNQVVMGLLSIRSPGALFIGPPAVIYPTPTVGFVDILVPAYISMTAGTFISEKAGINISMIAGTAITGVAGATITLTTPLVTHVAALTKMTGNLIVAGAIIGGTSITAAGSVVAGIDVLAPGVTLLTHVHGGVMPGPSVTSPPVL